MSVPAAAGFTAVFEMMRDSNKPAIGHNLSFDLTFCLSSFAQSLPPSWPAYKQLVQRWFPAGVWDTKHLARQLQVCPLLCFYIASISKPHFLALSPSGGMAHNI